jgi:hypothetical protein
MIFDDDNENKRNNCAGDLYMDIGKRGLIIRFRRFQTQDCLASGSKKELMKPSALFWCWRYFQSTPPIKIEHFFQWA